MVDGSKDIWPIKSDSTNPQKLSSAGDGDPNRQQPTKVHLKKMANKWK